MTEAFDVRIVSGARKHSISRRRIEQALLSQTEAHPLPKEATMSRRGKPAYKITGPEIDLKAEVVLDSKGCRVDQAYVDRALAEVEEEIAKRAGRPSLTGKSEHSPHVSFRITPELKARAEQTAREQGTTVSKLAREAFERFLAS